MTTTPTLRDAAKAGPCPFCGSAALKHKYDSTHWVGCSSCYSSSTQFDTEEQAIAAWNRRAALAAPADALAELVVEHYRNAIAEACEGWTMSDGLRKHLETALWNPPAAQTATQLQQAVARALGSLPKTPQEIAEFIGVHFEASAPEHGYQENSMNLVNPTESDRYTLTAHDLLSSFSELAEYAAIRAKGQQ